MASTQILLFPINQMLIYLDAMIVQHVADHADFIFQDIISDQNIRNPAKEAKLAAELFVTIIVLVTIIVIQ